MSDYVPTDPPRRGLRGGLIAALIAVAFGAGLLLMGLAVRNRWLAAPETTAMTAPARSTTGPGFTPAQPLNASGEAPPSMIDPAVLMTREAALAGQLAALEARTATTVIDANAAGAQATRAEGLLVAFAARRSLDRGLGLGYLEEQLRTRFGATQPRAVTTVIQAGRAPVTLEDLRQGLDAIAPDITGVGGATWFENLRREFGSLVVLREAGTPSPLPADRMARAHRLLEGGQVDAARAEIARLPSVGQAANWMKAAQRYILARQALDTIESAALMGQPAVQAASTPAFAPTSSLAPSPMSLAPATAAQPAVGAPLDAPMDRTAR